MFSDIATPTLARQGRQWIAWAGQQMPVLRLIKERFQRTRPLRGVRIGCCLHVTSETANLLLTLKAGGAHVALAASNPLSTQDAIAASLVRHCNIAVFARRGEHRSRYYAHLRSVLAIRPHITMDDGADLISALHREAHPRDDVLGGTEETTTGVMRLRSLERQGRLRFPIIAVNDANTKHLFDNRYGTGQSTIDGILRATNTLIAGTRFVVCGYGWCGRGIALRARGMGAHVIVTEVDPTKALEAVMDGFEVLPMARAARAGDIFVTATGNTHVIRGAHLQQMRDGALLANAGHFNVEVDVATLQRLSRRRRVVMPNVEEYQLRNGRRLYVLGEGRLVNLACAAGHPPQVMDMSFANQALACEYLVSHARQLARRVYAVPAPLDALVAQLKLKALGMTIDRLTPAQTQYLASWDVGT